jgi:hypothetical protein
MIQFKKFDGWCNLAGRGSKCLNFKVAKFGQFQVLKITVKNELFKNWHVLNMFDT